MDRRGFLASALGAGNASARPPMTYRQARHGGDVSLLGFGMMRLPTTDGRSARDGGTIDQIAVNALVDRAIEAGVNYFDTSPVYCTGQCEKSTGIALARHPREKWLVAAKLSNFNPKLWPLDSCRKMFAESLRLLQTDHIDFYLLHSVGNGGFGTFKGRYLDNGALEWLLRERDAGRIRNLGFSFHGDIRVWEWLVERHDKYAWDFAQIQMNYVDWRHAAANNARNTDAERLYGDLASRDIPVVVMEPLLGGRLARFNAMLARLFAGLDPEASFAKWAFRFIGTRPKVLTILTGISCREHLEEDIAIFSPLKPLSEREDAAVLAAGDAFMEDRSVPCTDCAYCMPCPYGIDIPTVFDTYNAAIADRRLPDLDNAAGRDFTANARRFLAEYDTVLPELRRAEHCIGCGRCRPHCPQSIDIPHELRRLDVFVERLRRKVSVSA